MRIYTLFLLVVFSLSSFSQESVSLRLNPEVGDEFTVTVDQKQDITQTIMGMEQKITQDQAIRVVYECTGVSKDAILMDATIDGAKLSTSGAVGDTDYDSDNPSDEATGQALVYSAMIGSVLKAEFNVFGQIEKVTGVNAMMEKVADAFDFAEGPERDAFMDEVAKSISDESFAKDFGASMITFPKEEMSVGDTWTSESTVQTQTLLKVVTTYTVQEITDDQVVLSVEGNISTDSSSSDPVVVSGMELVYSLGGTQAGSIRIDREKGWVTTSTIDLDISGEVEMMPNAQVPEGLTWPLMIKSTIVTTTE
ncbi:DUF6263 family protein [Phaeocystidibacter luteus]|uniref:Uncharacterized protein n=1 Tax=Phaeocystidibacter luteus TaxID=911197 RepID=A0A6N6REU8_9FLAO|nr:DUF6263 family protein [Phaeocystidibacter luteus]KAB2807348.1 hypothetical protein F8C67_12275 [Phaeocystidibacter luteus]